MDFELSEGEQQVKALRARAEKIRDEIKAIELPHVYFLRCCFRDEMFYLCNTFTRDRYGNIIRSGGTTICTRKQYAVLARTCSGAKSMLASYQAGYLDGHYCGGHWRLINAMEVIQDDKANWPDPKFSWR